MRKLRLAVLAVGMIAAFAAMSTNALAARNFATYTEADNGKTVELKLGRIDFLVSLPTTRKADTKNLFNFKPDTRYYWRLKQHENEGVMKDFNLWDAKSHAVPKDVRDRYDSAAYEGRDVHFVWAHGVKRLDWELYEDYASDKPVATYSLNVSQPFDPITISHQAARYTKLGAGAAVGLPALALFALIYPLGC